MVMPQAGELVAALVAFDEPVYCWAFTSEISEVKKRSESKIYQSITKQVHA